MGWQVPVHDGVVPISLLLPFREHIAKVPMHNWYLTATLCDIEKGEDVEGNRHVYVWAITPKWPRFGEENMVKWNVKTLLLSVSFHAQESPGYMQCTEDSVARRRHEGVQRPSRRGRKGAT